MPRPNVPMVVSSIVADELMIVEPMSCMHGTRAVSVVMNQSNQTAVDGRGDARSAARHVY